MAQKIADLIAKPVVVTLWERDRSYHNRGEMDPVTVQPDPFWVYIKALKDMDKATRGIEKNLRAIAAFI